MAKPESQDPSNGPESQGLHQVRRSQEHQEVARGSRISLASQIRQSIASVTQPRASAAMPFIRPPSVLEPNFRPADSCGSHLPDVDDFSELSLPSDIRRERQISSDIRRATIGSTMGAQGSMITDLQELKDLQEQLPYQAWRTSVTDDMVSGMAVQLTTFRQDRSLCRGCPGHNVLHLLGSILGNSAGSAATYGLSEVVDHIDHFISHNWSVNRWIKFLVLAYNFNLRRAGFVCGLLAVVGCALTATGVLPDFQPAGNREEGFKTEGYVGQIFFAPTFLLVLFFGHEPQWATSWTTYTTFLDKTCIHQTDQARQKEGIVKLGAFLGMSKRIVICYTDVYLRKLWTVYEIACFLCMHPVENMTLIHTHWALTSVGGLLFIYWNNMMYWMPLPSFVRALILYPVAVAFSFWTRRLFREVNLAKRRIKDFSVKEAMCFCEDDRPFVEDNIILLLKFYAHIPSNASREVGLEAFNSVVRNNMPRALSASMGTSGLPYRFIFAMAFPLACSYLTDREGIIVKQSGLFSRRVVVWTISDMLDCFLLLPSLLQTLAWLMTKCADLQGFCEKLYVAVVVFWALAFILSVNLVLGLGILFPWAETSNMGLIVFVVYVLAWVGYTFFIFNRCSCCRRNGQEGSMAGKWTVEKKPCETVPKDVQIHEVPGANVEAMADQDAGITNLTDVRVEEIFTDTLWETHGNIDDLALAVPPSLHLKALSSGDATEDATMVSEDIEGLFADSPPVITGREKLITVRETEGQCCTGQSGFLCCQPATSKPQLLEHSYFSESA